MSEEGLQIAEKRKEAKGKGEKKRYTHFKEYQGEIRKTSSVIKEMEEKN